MSNIEAFGYSCALALALVLVIASGAKLFGQAATRASFRDLRLPAPEVLAVAVPVSEGLVALALVIVPWVGATAALALLSVFTVFLVAQWRTEATVGCACFGGVSSTAVGIAALVRNGALMALGLGALAAGAPGNPGWGALIAISILLLLGTATRAFVLR